MIADVLGPRGVRIERTIVEAGARGSVIAIVAGVRSLVSLVPGEIDPEVLRPHPGWDLELSGAEVVATDEGAVTILVERLGDGIPSTDLAGSHSGTPAFVIELADRMVAAHAAGLAVGMLQPALVFAQPETRVLVGVAQRPLRADSAATKAEGSPALFGAMHLSPGDFRAEPAEPADDGFRLASMVWHWRHGREPFADLSLADRLSLLGGHGPAGAGLAAGQHAVDELDALLLHYLARSAPEEADVSGLRRALARVGADW